jgi:mRNA interferase MazF
MAPSSYIPEAGDLVWLEFDPQAGHEQAGHRPALVISPAAYNAKSGLMLCCPVTTKIKGYPFEVITEVAVTSSVIIADQVKSLDFKARNAKKKGEVPLEVLTQVRGKILSLVSGI